MTQAELIEERARLEEGKAAAEEAAEDVFHMEKNLIQETYADAVSAAEVIKKTALAKVTTAHRQALAKAQLDYDLGHAAANKAANEAAWQATGVSAKHSGG